MPIANGVVVRIETRTTGPGKFGKPGTAYDIVLDDGVAYGAGFKSPRCSTGDQVSFEYKENGRFKNVDQATIKVHASGVTPSAAPTPAAYTPKSGGFPVAVDSDKFAIIRQNALTNAVAAFDHFAPANNNELSLDAYVDQILTVAYAFTDFSSGQREVKAMEKLSESV